jgi:hypothetical protein
MQVVEGLPISFGPSISQISFIDYDDSSEHKVISGAVSLKARHDYLVNITANSQGNVEVVLPNGDVRDLSKEGDVTSGLFDLIPQFAPTPGFLPGTTTSIVTIREKENPSVHSDFTFTVTAV